MKTTTRATAISSHCRSCISDPSQAGTWRQQVAICGSTSCALWQHRPMPQAGTMISAALIKSYALRPDAPALVDLRSRGFSVGTD